MVLLGMQNNADPLESSQRQKKEKRKKVLTLYLELQFPGLEGEE